MQSDIISIQNIHAFCNVHVFSLSKQFKSHRPSITIWIVQASLVLLTKFDGFDIFPVLRFADNLRFAMLTKKRLSDYGVICNFLKEAQLSVMADKLYNTRVWIHFYEYFSYL